MCHDDIVKGCVTPWRLSWQGGDAGGLQIQAMEKTPETEAAQRSPPVSGVRQVWAVHPGKCCASRLASGRPSGISVCRVESGQPVRALPQCYARQRHRCSDRAGRSAETPNPPTLWVVLKNALGPEGATLSNRASFPEKFFGGEVTAKWQPRLLLNRQFGNKRLKI